jgi:hypothetical protein
MAARVVEEAATVASSRAADGPVVASHATQLPLDTLPHHPSHPQLRLYTTIQPPPPSAPTIVAAGLLEDLHLWTVQGGGQLGPEGGVEALGAVLGAAARRKQRRKARMHSSVERVEVLRKHCV